MDVGGEDFDENTMKGLAMAKALNRNDTSLYSSIADGKVKSGKIDKMIMGKK